jgi:hypothetical protein
METRKATIKRETDKASLILTGSTQEHEIILSEDNPNDVKHVFNNLLKDLKKGVFQFELDDNSIDLYHNICKEYIIQLNSEIRSIHAEMEEFDLLEKPEE